MAKRKTVKKEKTVSSKELTFNYVKTPSYRTYHVDGIYGGLTPNGNVYCELFIDRNVTPQTVVHELDENGKLSGVPKKKTGKTGYIREIECGIIMDIEAALTMKEWLGDKIDQYQKTLKSLNKIKKPKK